MPFTPKFVDLVRNVTTVLGSGPVALGAAVPGYAGFADTITVGEQFYYCIQGVDKPAEREVGRGTMQAGGAILREPIGGAATSFTGGTKTIALVAAAEWFSRIELGGQAGAIGVASRTALAAKAVPSTEPTILTESGREGLFVFDSSNLSAKVTADPGQGIYVAPAAAPTGASGAWTRKYDGAVNVRWFGAKGDGTTNDGAAFVAALAHLKARAIVGYGYSKGSAELFVPAGVFFLGTTTLDLTHSLCIRGETAGGASGGSSVLKWTNGTTGIRTQAVNTIGATGFDNGWTEYTSGNSVTICNLLLHGGYSNGAESEAHGIHLRVSAQIRDVAIHNFPGDGIFARAAAGGGGTVEGNANICLIDHVFVQNCRNGLYVDSADVNAWAINAFNAASNRQWGVWDSSFLGNTYTACHVAANGWDGVVTSGPGIPTGCTLSGNRYYVKRDQAAGASTNAPSGTTADNGYWGFIGAGGIYSGVVPWVSGTTFREGGAYRTDDPNAANVLTGCYSEGDQNPGQFASPTLIIGGLHGAGIGGYGGMLRGGAGLTTPGDLAVGKQLTVTGQHNANGQVVASAGIAVTGGTFTTSGAPVGLYSNSISMGLNTGNTDVTFTMQNSNYYNTLSFLSHLGGVQTNDAAITSIRGAGLSINGSNLVSLAYGGVNAMQVGAAGAVVVRSGIGIGYGAGSGGAVAQATSKATGVTLNKASGQVTLHNAALAAGASVSFTLTNSVIAATDLVLINIGSGATADAYAVEVSAVAAGSCRIQVRNSSGAALSEAMLLNVAVIKAVAA